jgi:DNA repair protein RadC
MQVKQEIIHDLTMSDRPRDRLYVMRSYDLSTAELLTMILGPGNGKCSGIKLASKVLAVFDNSLSNLSKCSIGDLMRISGIGRAKASALVAFAELSRRRQAEEALEKPRINDSADSINYFAPLFRDLRYTAYGILFLGQDGQVLDFEIPFEGGISSATVDIRLILKKTLMHNAISIILCHNKVSALAKPSKSDEQLTERLRGAAKTIDIKLLDHIIIGENDSYSFADDGKIN